MKYFRLRLIIALVIFVIGITVVGLWNSEAIPEIEKFISPQTYKEKEKTKAWKTFLSFEDQDLSKLSREQQFILWDALDKISKKPYIYEGSVSLISKISNENNEINYILMVVSQNL